MARPRRTPEQRADDSFRTEIRTRAAEINLRSQKAQADRAGMSQPTYSRRLQNPAEITVKELRGIIQAMNPDPKIVLALLGIDGT